MFHPLINLWFKEKYSGMTDAQAKAWPLIGQGENVLVVAPTGSGKTLTAFLGAIDNLVRGVWPGGGVKVLYISPLKALNNDIRRNLLAPLAELSACFARHGQTEQFPSITVQTRSGDSTSEERRRLLHHPPDILVTTPESLGIMLCSKGGRGMLGTVRLVILDEIHALFASKRGTQLIASVEQLTLLSGEFQRIGLSATVRPAPAVAAWMGGYCPNGPDAWLARPVRVVESSDQRRIRLDITSVKTPDLAPDRDPGQNRDAWWESLAAMLVQRIRAQRSTLVFTNSRRLTEKLTRFINEAAGGILAYSHHGSLSKEVRLDVEQRLKDGELKAIVATSSLELGIDIGVVDKVILVQAPFAVASALQRIGRASHQVGAVSHAELIPLHGLDLVYGTVLGDMVRGREIESLQAVQCPLDVLAQVLLSLTLAAEWRVDDLYRFVRCIHPYHGLSRRFFDLTIDMLCGRYADLPIRELKSRLEPDVLQGTVRARSGTELLLYQSGGTITDRGYYQLRRAGDQALLGELDEEFVWERRLGDQFTLGTAAWRITGVTQNAVEVVPADPSRLMVPFWKAEDLNRDFHVASAVGGFLEKANGRLGDPDFMEWLEGEHGLDPVSSENLVRFLSWQRSASGCDLPSRHHVLVEEIGPGADADPGHRPVPAQLVIHTFFGGRVNKPLALALCAAWERRHGSALEYFAGNECLVIQLPDAGGGADALWEIMAAEVNSGTVEALLRHKMESTGLFGARFRENAARSLLLPRGNARKRVPLWMTRMRARKLLDAVASSTDFPVLVETWRDCLEDEFDLASLKLVLDELARGEIRISRRSGREPSPFAADLVWRQINHDMYQDDTPAPGRGSALGDDLFRELLGEERLRPAVPEDLATAFAAKLQGTMPEYRPDTPGELVAVLCEHGFMPAKLWDELCCYSSRGAALDPAFDEDLTRLSRLFARFRPPGAATDWIVAVPQLPSILSGMGLWRTAMPVEFSQEVAQWLQEHPDPDPPVQPERLLLRWLERQGPVLLSRIVWMFGWSEDRCLALLQALILDELVVSGRLVEGSDALRFCEAQNYERLLRLHRTSRREGVAILPVDRLPLFLGAWHGLVAPVANPDLPALQEVLDRCMAYPLPAALWEEVVLPCRLRPYQPALLDSLFANYGLIWQGNGEGRVFLALNDEAPLYAPAPVAPEAAPPAGSDDARVLAALGAALPAGAGLGLLELARSLGLDSGRANDALWSLAWQGRVTADSFETLRRGIRNGFTAGEATAGRGGFRRWESTRATVGRWRRFVAESSGLDAVDRLEGSRELVSQLLRRHGVVFREILANELPQLQWTAVIRVLRLMELSGEVLAGRFFEGIPGIQFASPEAARRLAAWDFNAPAWAETVWWVNAQDPASLCGLGVPMAPPAPPEGSGATPATAAGLELPRRVASNWLVYAGSRLVMVVRRQGRELDIDLPGDDALLGRVLAFFPFLLSRSLETGPAVVVETINGQPAAAVPHAAGFRQAGFLADHHGLSLWKRY